MTGPWTFAGIEILGTIHSDFSINESKKPDLQIVLQPSGISQDGCEYIRKSMGIAENVSFSYYL